MPRQKKYLRTKSPRSYCRNEQSDQELLFSSKIIIESSDRLAIVSSSAVALRVSTGNHAYETESSNGTGQAAQIPDSYGVRGPYTLDQVTACHDQSMHSPTTDQIHIYQR